MVVVRVKVGFLANLFVLSLQKVGVFWLFWLLLDCSFSFVYLFVYGGIFFVVVNLLLIRDLWLLLVYSSIANTGIIILGVFGSHYIFFILLYLSVIFLIVYLVSLMDSYMELLILVFFFLVIPPFILFFIKFYVILRLDFIMKLGFFLVMFDVFVLLYYFSIVFIKFILIDIGVLVYFLNLLMVLFIILFRN